MDSSNKNYEQISDDDVIAMTVKALNNNGIETTVVDNGAQAREKLLAMIPEGSEVMDMSSTTLLELKIPEMIKTDNRFQAIKNKLSAMGDSQAKEKKRLGAVMDYAIGSVHAVTQDGHVLVASYTGSQLPAYVYGALHVIWVVGTQKIVKDTEAGIKRIYKYVLPLESERMRRVYKAPGSAVNKLLIFNKEIVAGRIKMILVKEKLGF